MNPEILSSAQAVQSQCVAHLKQVFVGKDEIADVMGVCLVARENLFLLGPPGTAKTALVHELARTMDARSFDYLLTRFTEPSELFGPFDIRKLREGDLVTNTEGMLPEADLIFLDELLNANSAILNSLLMVLNERVFRRGRETRALPALLVVGASNGLPEEETLRALFDRFLLRVRCGPVPHEQLGAVLEAGWRMEKRAKVDTGITADYIRQLQGQIASVDLSLVREAYLSLVGKLRQAGIGISDRRAVRLQRVIAASALLSGRLEARVSDLWVLRHIWDREEQIEILEAQVHQCLRQENATAGDHPRARHSEAPDPEELSQALESLSEKLTDESATMRESARDELRLLASRIEWVRNDTARTALQSRAAELWSLAAAS